MFFWNKFCGLNLLFFISTNFSYAQLQPEPLTTNTKISLNNKPFVSQPVFNTHFQKKLSTSYPQTAGKGLNQNEAVFSQQNLNQTSSVFIPANLATCNYGFFCREEIKIEQAVNIPIRFRLGSLEQCNYYEGKH